MIIILQRKRLSDYEEFNILLNHASIERKVERNGNTNRYKTKSLTLLNHSDKDCDYLGLFSFLIANNIKHGVIYE